jgi:hypothetical protein
VVAVRTVILVFGVTVLAFSVAGQTDRFWDLDLGASFAIDIVGPRWITLVLESQWDADCSASTIGTGVAKILTF